MQSYRAGKRTWYVIDANKQIVGRLASKVIPLLTGKKKPTWKPSVDSGDFVVIINAKNICFTGKKWRQKLYYKHTGYPGGLKVKNAEMIHEKDPTDVLRRAINGMLPKNFLRRERMKRLHIFEGNEHKFSCQKPIVYDPLGQDAVYSELEY